VADIPISRLLRDEAVCSGITVAREVEMMLKIEVAWGVKQIAASEEKKPLNQGSGSKHRYLPVQACRRLGVCIGGRVLG